MAFHFSKRKLRPKEEEEMGELNIVPYLDILMNLIIFMLLSMTGLATFGILNVNAPNYGAGAGAGADDQKQPLLLTVGIAKQGYYVAATGAVLPGIAEGQANLAGAPTIAKLADGTYDAKSLTDKMKEVKASFPQESKVIIAAETDVPYEALVLTMDALRETSDKKLLFPDVTLASF
ncbi:MAG: biopolymer transporter ExbD [Myxococcaceae bacterium]|nr:biopolymer transporter ExbD [Myxococcaceae bacterium]